jgi:hypothetical protein
MEDDSHVETLLTKIQALESTVISLQDDRNLLINHMIHLITHISAYVINRIDSSQLCSRIGSLKDDLKRR